MNIDLQNDIVTVFGNSENYENIEADEDGRKRKCMGRPVAKKLAIDGKSIAIVPVDRIVEQGQEITKESMELGETDKAAPV